MEEKTVKRIELENNQVVEIRDLSRKISEDAFIVKMTACMHVKVEKSLFSDSDLMVYSFDDILDKIGNNTQFEYVSERNFIRKPDREEVFDGLVDDFCKTMLKYLSKPDFPGKMILNKIKNT